MDIQAVVDLDITFHKLWVDKASRVIFSADHKVAIRADDIMIIVALVPLILPLHIYEVIVSTTPEISLLVVHIYFCDNSA